MVRVSFNRFRSIPCLGLVVSLVAFLLTLPAHAAITLDSTSTGSATQGATSLSWNHTLGTGGSRMVVCGITYGYNDTSQTSPLSPAPSMTFNGVAMTSAFQAPTHTLASSSKIYSQIFYISDAGLNAASGSLPVVVTIPTAVTAGASGGCTSMFGVSQSAPEATVGGYYSSGYTGVSLTATLTTLTAGDWVVDAMAGGYGSSGSMVVDSGQTKLYNLQSAAGSKTTAGSNGGEISAGSYELVPTPGSVTMGWTATVSRATYAMAAFAPAPTANYTVTTAASPTGGGSVTLNPSGGSYASGSNVQVTAVPAVGYTFSNFTGDLTGTTNPQMLAVNGNKSVTANFTASLCTLSKSVIGSGSITLSPTAANNAYVCGTPVTVTGVPAGGYSFGEFTGALTGATNGQTLTVNTSTSVTATFVQGTACHLTESVTGSGTVSVSPSGDVFSCGTNLTVTANPAQYYSLTGFSGAITGTVNPQNFTINADSSIAAAFAQTSFPINTTIVGPGTVTASPPDTGNGYAANTQVSLTATPNAGANFIGFSGDLTGTTNPQTLTVTGTRNVTATFAAQVITQDAVSHASSTGAAGTLSWTHTIGSGVNRAMVIAVGEADSVASPDQYATVTSVTFNGIYATPIPGSMVYGGTSGMVQSQLFYLLDSELPAAGTYTVQVNLTGTIGGISAGAVSLAGVSQGPPEAVTTNKNTSGANLISTSITTLTNNAWVVDVLEDGDTATLTANTGQTLQWQAEAALGTAGSSTEAVATAGPVSLGWSANANRLVQSLAAFPPATSIVPATYTLTTSAAGGSGTVSANPGLTNYPTGTGVLLTATPATGFAFAGWTGDYASSANPLPITMTANHTVVANFTTAATCTLALNINGAGTVTPAAGTFNCGTVLTLQATPSAGYTFGGYSGDFTSTDNPAYFTLNANSTINVEFDPVPTCSLNITTVGQGTVTPASAAYPCGTVLSLQAMAAANYAFSGFTGDLDTTANPATLTLNQNTNITATFVSGSTCTLTTSVTGQGTITPSSGSWACGTTIAIQADAAAKYLFNGWGGALSGSASPTTLTLATNATVTASFVVNVAGVTGDTRTVTQPVYPAVCTVLTAVQSVAAPVETAPDTTRVQAALNACPVGEAVEFSASADGTANAFILQPITLPAGVTMLVDPQITILGSIKYADYNCDTSAGWCSPLINVAPNAYPNPGSAIMGLGIIDGRGGVTLTDKGKSWWATGQDARPRLIYLSSHTTGASSDNFTAYQITLQNSPKFHLSGVGNDWTVWGVKIKAPPDSPNTDGIDPSGSSNITITNSWISDGDDWVSPKADSGHIANVTVENLHTFSGHGISIGSETNAGLNNMYVHDIVIDNGFGGTSFDSLRIKSGASEGGEVYDVLYKNICINHGGDTIVIDPYYTSASGTLYPNFHDITFSNIHKLIHDSSHKSTMTGYNTSGVVFPLTVTLDNVAFDSDTANDFKAPDNFNNVQFTFGPGPVSMASFLEADAAVPSNYITVTNSVSNSNAAYDCTNAFVYLEGDLTAKVSTVTAGSNATITAILQNLVSPVMAGTISYPQQNAPTGTIQLLEGGNVVGSGSINGRLTYITVPSVTTGSHTYTAQYLGDGNYSPMAFGSFTLVVTNAAPTANSQNVAVNYNTATPITLTASGSGTITYAVASNPAHGTLTGTAPSVVYTPNAGFTGADSFTFTASNGTVSAPATVSLTVSGTGSQSQSITFPAPPASGTYGDAAVSLTAMATSNLPVTYAVSGPGAISGSLLSYTGVGSIVITASQAGNGTYSAATPVQRTIQVNPAVLNVGVLGSPTRYFGQANPAFSYTMGTFLDGDTQATATSGTPILTTTATPKSDAGSYIIDVELGSLLAPNYTFNPVPGQLTVTGGAAQSLFFPPIANLANGSSILLIATSTSGLPVTLQVTGGPASLNGNVLTVNGTGAITVSASQAGNNDFAQANTISQTFTAH
jgi:polygalacturonase